MRPDFLTQKIGFSEEFLKSISLSDVWGTWHICIFVTSARSLNWVGCAILDINLLQVIGHLERLKSSLGSYRS